MQFRWGLGIAVRLFYSLCSCVVKTTLFLSHLIFNERERFKYSFNYLTIPVEFPIFSSIKTLINLINDINGLGFDGVVDICWRPH